MMVGLRMDFSMLLEPLGFVKVLEWLFAIFAFATCGGFHGETALLVSCKGVVNKTITAAFAYPFRLNTVVFSAPDPKGCGGTWTDVYLTGNFSSSAQFFVALATLVFFYCVAALVVYIGYYHVYQQNNKFPLTDLAISVLTAFLWLVSTFVWAKALADIKVSTGASIIPGIESCKAAGTTCHFLSVTSMGVLNVSVVFGLLNMILWAGNVWLVYKDTNLHNQWNRISESPTERGEGLMQNTAGFDGCSSPADEMKWKASCSRRCCFQSCAKCAGTAACGSTSPAASMDRSQPANLPSVRFMCVDTHSSRLSQLPSSSAGHREPNPMQTQSCCSSLHGPSWYP